MNTCVQINMLTNRHLDTNIRTNKHVQINTFVAIHMCQKRVQINACVPVNNVTVFHVGMLYKQVIIQSD